MREFDKIYIAKYKDVLTIRQLAKDLKTTNTEIINTISFLKTTDILNVYNKIPDEEWEKLEKYTDEAIKRKYYGKSKKLMKTVIQKILIELNFNSIKECLEHFPIYVEEDDPILTEKKFTEIYINDKNFINEEWKIIGNTNYSVSNYGRIKNNTTNKLKKLRWHKFGMQIVLWANSKRQTITISRLVAEVFLRHLNDNERVIHIDGNIRNNYYKNLKIVSK